MGQRSDLFINNSLTIKHSDHKNTTFYSKNSRYILNITKKWGDINMFRWAIIFAVIALIASLLGFGGVAGLSKDFAVILLVVAVILAIVGFISRGRV